MIIDLQAIAQQSDTNYPDDFKARVSGRIKQRLGTTAGLENFGVNWVTLAPGSQSALRHWHEKQDEFIYVVAGELCLVDDSGEHRLMTGMMAAFPAGEANGHHLVNRSEAAAIYLEIGDRTPADTVHYPDDDLVAKHSADGWQFSRQPNP